MTFVLLLAGALAVAYANGANDNFKGVATLYGSGTVGYRGALAWATLTTFAGSLCSVALAQGLVKAFSAKGLVPDTVAAAPEFLTAVAVGAALTIFLATVTGFPISTTHALTGGLVGAGLVAAKGAVNLSLLGKNFFLPLMVSPFLALLLGGAAYPVFRQMGLLSGVSDDWCVCIGERERFVPVSGGSAQTAAAVPGLDVSLDTEAHCSRRHWGPVLRFEVPSLLDAGHFLSAGAVSFARGLNDAPKIAGLMLLVQALELRVSLVLIASVMAVGGLAQARKVAETVGHRITRMNHGQGFVANLVTSLLVLTASHSGLPVSTTHVSVGSLFGMGLVTRQADRGVIRQVILSWVLTLPVAALLAASASWVLA